MRTFGGKAKTRLIATIIASALTACAHPVASPPSYTTESGAAPATGLVPTHVIGSGEPLSFVGPTAAQREEFEKSRTAFESGREKRIQARKERALSGSNSFGGMAAKCVGTMLVFAPLCIVIVPATYGVASAVEGRAAASREAYMPAFPSEEELFKAYETIRSRITAPGIAKRLNDELTQSEKASDTEYPRLRLRAGPATFVANRNTHPLITITIIAQAEPQPGILWEPTEHQYHFAYGRDLVHELERAEGEIAKSIASRYAL